MKKAERLPVPRESLVLVVDDEPDIRELLELTFIKMGIGVSVAGSVSEAKHRLQETRFDLCLTDMRLPDGEGLDLVRHIATLGFDVPVAVITAYGSAENAVAALKAGAFDYVSKPIGLEQLRALVKSVLSLPERASGQALEGQQLLGESPALKQVRELVGKLARTQAPVYLSGESGSGKELAARLIHGNWARRDKRFVPVNCGAIPENLMESEFFGYRKGAFTGADQDRDGFFQAANGGTLFLDEVADLPLADVCAFFQLPLPQGGGATLRDWLTDKLARDAVEGDGIDWHGAHFRVISVHEGRINRVGLALAPKAVLAS